MDLKNALLTDLAVISTPEIASSSPMTVEEMMEASPIPQKVKAPECSVVEIPSPSPLYTPEVNEDEDDDSMVLDSPAPISRKASFEVPRGSFAEYVSSLHSWS